jgi:hypothetical protein
MVFEAHTNFWLFFQTILELASASRKNRACTLPCSNKTVTLGQFKNFLCCLLRYKKIPNVQSILRPKSLLALSTLDPSRSFTNVLWESSNPAASKDLDSIYGVHGTTLKFYRENITVNCGNNREEADANKDNTCDYQRTQLGHSWLLSWLRLKFLYSFSIMAARLSHTEACNPARGVFPNS